MTHRPINAYFWNEVRVNEWRRDLIEPCSECGMATFHLVRCSKSNATSEQRDAAQKRRRYLDERRRAWRESIGG